MRKITTINEKETIDLGKKIGLSCQGGEVFALKGELGSGKTCLSKGIALGLGVKDRVNSPTFNIMKVYSIKKGNIKTFCHVDAYRLDRETKLENIGLEEYLFDRHSVCVVEWSDNIKIKINKKLFTKIVLKIIKNDKRVIVV